MSDRELKPDEIHLYFAFPDEIDDAELLSVYANLMNPAERQRQARFVFEKDRHRFLVTRALIRTTLSRYARIDPAKWRFSTNKYGRPEVMSEESFSRLRFNISHTNGLIVCAVVLDEEIGVDVEDIGRKIGGGGIAERFFASQEVSDLHSIAENNRREWFFYYWTLKESYIKARGMGLSLPLKQFAFHILEKDRIGISFDAKIDDNPELWQFWLMAPTACHRVAVSVRRKRGRLYQLLMKKVVPLAQEQTFPAPLLKQSHRQPDIPLHPEAFSL
jgi:4'-phosphopantetheinyl transferase